MSTCVQVNKRDSGLSEQTGPQFRTHIWTYNQRMEFCVILLTITLIAHKK